MNVSGKLNFPAASLPVQITSGILRQGPPLWYSSQEFLATDPEVPGSIPGATRFSEK
jgi:hypothetical protein